MRVAGRFHPDDMKIFISVLLVLIFIALCGNLAATYYQGQKQMTENAQQEAKSQSIFNKVCTSFDRLANLLPPPIASAAADPSRVYLHNQHDVLASLGPDIQCPANLGGK